MRSTTHVLEIATYIPGQNTLLRQPTVGRSEMKFQFDIICHPLPQADGELTGY